MSAPDRRALPGTALWCLGSGLLALALDQRERFTDAGRVSTSGYSSITLLAPGLAVVAAALLIVGLGRSDRASWRGSAAAAAGLAALIAAFSSTDSSVHDGAARWVAAAAFATAAVAAVLGAIRR